MSGTIHTPNPGVSQPSYVTGESVGTKRGLHIIDVSAFQWDEIDVTYPDAVTEVFTYKLSAATVKTLTVTYSDSTKSTLLNVTRS
jgi:hypothetical protein